MATPKLANGDRVRLVGSGVRRATATVVDAHTTKGGRTVSIQPDDRPRSAGCVVVDITSVVRVAGPTVKCPLCSERHSVWDCPTGA